MITVSAQKRIKNLANSPPGLIPLQKRSLGAYLGLAIGDALGATVEFMTPSEIRFTYGEHNTICGGGWLKLKPGQVTDDTTMSLALGESIIKNSQIDALNAAEAFDSWMKTKPVDIGNTVRRGIVRFRHNGTVEGPLNEHDAGNGACMRVLPIALATFASGENYIDANRAQAHVTHNSPISDAGCECVIDIIHTIFKNKDRDELKEGPIKSLINSFPAYQFESSYMDNPSGYIVDTLQCVFQAFFSTDSFEAALINVVNRGGDADTTGSILGMIAGSYYGVDAIPNRWLKKLDTKIRIACEKQALELIAL